MKLDLELLNLESNKSIVKYLNKDDFKVSTKQNFINRFLLFINTGKKFRCELYRLGIFEYLLYMYIFVIYRLSKILYKFIDYPNWFVEAYLATLCICFYILYNFLYNFNNNLFIYLLLICSVFFGVSAISFIITSSLIYAEDCINNYKEFDISEYKFSVFICSVFLVLSLLIIFFIKLYI